MVQFNKLRLNGFKSFVDRTELEIGKGLTGIVGPNGCGKSNLVEALRWVMGENSAKRMRGDGMEDVIFNGTSQRSARNFAEVSLLLDNSDRNAPAAYNGQDEIEVIRRIERDQGSAYKINGKTSRARDVQMLFADTVSGAHSPALVSQGRVTALINAKPQERRLVLEESAGISGIYARRHEAELRLRAADANIKRLDDLVGGMEGRLSALKKQSRQALKYKTLSAQIRQLEISVAYLEWRMLRARLDQTNVKLAETESLVAERMATVAQLTRTQTTQAADIPGLRKAEAELAASLQAQKITFQRLEDQEKELDAQLSETRLQIERTGEDRLHEQETLEESIVTLSRLEIEEKAIVEEQSRESKIFEEKLSIKERVEEKVLRLEKEYASFMENAAAARARRQALEQQKSSEESRLLVARERREDLDQKLRAAQAGFEGDVDHDQLKRDIVELEKDVEAMRGEMDKEQAAFEKARQAVGEARETLQSVERQKSNTETEINALKSLLEEYSQDTFRPVFQDVQPDQGFETALSRALGESLMASTEADAPSVWLAGSLSPAALPALPEGAVSLEPRIRAPQALRLALSQIGVVQGEAQGKALFPKLKPGQSIVSMDGAYWRWDGLHIKATASDRHATQLRHKSRLKVLEAELPHLAEQYEKAKYEFTQEQQNEKTSSEACNSLQSNLKDKGQALARKQAELTQATEKRSGLFAQIAKLEEAIAQCDSEMERSRTSIQETEKTLDACGEKVIEDHAREVERVKHSLSEAQSALHEALRDMDAIEQERSRRKARLHAIADERVNLQNRSIRSRERLRELEARAIQLSEKLEMLEKRPKTIGSDRQGLLDKISMMESSRNDAAEKLAGSEAELQETNKALRQAEGILSEARESRAAGLATLSAGREQENEIVRSIREQYEMNPEELGAHVSFDVQAETFPEIEDFRSQKDKFVRDRDLIGPVNLRAELEAEELEKEVGGMLHERTDLMQAIEELREGINTLNREARERLTAAFDQVNAHFQSLFTRLFGGGTAHLALIEADDPLESGLEIFAQPPGKTLQSLSLLSGGEQTLASISLIFAMFLTNPAPICVLDEIDAPLDDVNVDRVCNLLIDMAERAKTRFLIITHHRLTMARMDRLYGVTMSERGISQLVSVDLNRQMDFLEAAE